MTDKEVQEKIAGMYFSDRCQFCHSFGGKIEPYLCLNCAERIRKLGYRKLPKDKPPLLSMDDIKGDPKLIRRLNYFHKKYSFGEANRAVQREVCIKWYEEH